MQKLMPVCVVALVSLNVLSISGCGPGRTGSSERGINDAVETLRGGELVDRINEEEDRRTEDQTTTIADEAGNGVDTLSEGPDLADGTPPLIAQEPDPCESVPIPVKGATHAEMIAALNQFVVCVNELYKPARIMGDVLESLRQMKSEPNLDLADASIDDLNSYFESKKDLIKDAHGKLGVGNPHAATLRRSYTDKELEMMVALTRRRHNRLRVLEKQVIRAVEIRSDMIDYFADDQGIDRYAALRVLKETKGDFVGKTTTRAFARLFKKFNKSFEVPPEIVTPPGIIGLGLIHPYAFLALLPDVGQETAELHPAFENPFSRVKEAILEMSGPEALVENAKALYRMARDLERPKIPDHPPAAPDAVRVAFIDSGVDFQAEKELGLFMGDGTSGQLSSIDLGGTAGDNPWAQISLPEYAHGSKTMATLLTMVAQLEPSILEQRKLDLAMWKTKSDTGLLNLGIKSGVWWPHLAAHDDLIRKIESSPVQPKLISMSMSVDFWPYVEKSGKKDLIKDMPTLWVVSAGNQGKDLDEAYQAKTDASSCMQGFPDAHKDPKKILCVGALAQGVITPKIANYSNYGKLVDVYAFESYTKMCPNGTSCATPAITAAATMIASRYPSLSPAQLKEVIVEAAEEQELEVGLTVDSKEGISKGGEIVGGGRLGQKHKVRVFSPNGNTMERAYSIAARIASANAAL